MDTAIPARLTASQGRRVGLSSGLALVVTGLLLVWRRHPISADVALSFGGALAVAGLAMPTRLRPVERAVMQLARATAKVTTPIVMGLVYFFVLTPIGRVRRLTRSPIRRRRGVSGWQPHDGTREAPHQMERQF